MIYAIKKQNESNERLISRFKKLVQRSRIMNDVKGSRYHKRSPKKGYIRKAAVMRAHYRKKRVAEQLAS